MAPLVCVVWIFPAQGQEMNYKHFLPQKETSVFENALCNCGEDSLDVGLRPTTNWDFLDSVLFDIVPTSLFPQNFGSQEFLESVYDPDGTFEYRIDQIDIGNLVEIGVGAFSEHESFLYFDIADTINERLIDGELKLYLGVGAREF